MPISNTQKSYREELYLSNNSSLYSQPEFIVGAYSYADMVAHVSFKGKASLPLGTVSMLSVSTHRDKFPVTSLGRIGIRGTTAGHRTIGGTIVFASFDRNVWYRLVEGNDKTGKPRALNTILPDNLPPFDITISFVNEEGDQSVSGLTGVTILDEAHNYSVDSPGIMESYSYMAAGYIPFQPARKDTQYSQSLLVQAGSSYLNESERTGLMSQGVYVGGEINS